MSVNPHVDLLTQAWYRLGESRIMPSTLRSGKVVQARCTSWSNRCLLSPLGSLNSSRENPTVLGAPVADVTDVAVCGLVGSNERFPIRDLRRIYQRI